MRIPPEKKKEMKTPLEGVRVLDLSRLVAGNMLSTQLADFGADVIKIERPVQGDDLRHWREEGIETWWKVYGRNKRSIELDLKNSEDLGKLKILVSQSDVLLENFVPGKLEKMGLGVEVLHTLNPCLVIARVSGWGQTGPYAHKPGFGTLVEAMSGFAHLNGFPDREPALPPLAMADMYAGIYGAFGVLAALRNVEQGDGKGQIVDVALFESLYSTLASEAVKFQATGTANRRMGNQAINTAPRNIYECANGKYLALSASVQSMFENLARAISRPELIDDKRFLTNEDRVNHCEELNKILGDYFGQHSLEENLELMEAKGVTVAPVLSAADLLDHPYAVGRELFSQIPDDEMKICPVPNPVPRLSLTPGRIPSAAPLLGEHEEEIMQLIQKDYET